MGNLLDKIQNTHDLKKLPQNDLPALAEEIRAYILDVVSKNGGHLASNLGAIHLTLALHYVFNSPQDKIIWDVSHQCYTHKILTGRKKAFKTLRKKDGISGFTKRDESEHDVFGTGHASTSISAALGIACANEFKNDKSKVVAVIGDGSMTGGLAFEGLNQTGHLKKNMIVVLNDNEMSISKNVGALSSFVSKMSTSSFANRLRKNATHFLKSIPSVGDMLYHFAKKGHTLITGLLTSGLLFECLDFRYLGPIDGHNTSELIEAFENIKKIDEPVLIHVLTRKGNGVSYAMEDPESYHGLGPFDVDTGKAIKKSDIPSYTKIFGETACELAKKDNKIIAITAAMKDGTGLDEFAKKFPKRFFDVGIAEEHAVTFAAGLASQGYKPIVSVYSTFLQRAYDQIVHDVCLQNLPVVFALDRAGIVGNDGPTHHGTFDLSYLRHIPNMTVMASKDENELRHMLYTATKINSPVAIRYPRGNGEGVKLDKNLKELPTGKAEVVKLDGGKEYILIVAIGNTVYPSLACAEKLNTENINVILINARFIKPLDKNLILKYATKASLTVTIEENALAGGFGSAVLEMLEAENLLSKIKLKRIGISDQFVSHGTQAELRDQIGLSPDNLFLQILDAYINVVKDKKKAKGLLSLIR